jgi:hypothetical protein
MNAFPNVTGNQGMELRDYFAAKAMEAMIARSGHGYADSVVHEAYHIADLMMKAREDK